ncbi:MAG: hypothetical protein ACP5OG_00780 [Candidatus Nanoarchaeia archaeon]
MNINNLPKIPSLEEVMNETGLNENSQNSLNYSNLPSLIEIIKVLKNEGESGKNKLKNKIFEARKAGQIELSECTQGNDLISAMHYCELLKTEGEFSSRIVVSNQDNVSCHMYEMDYKNSLLGKKKKYQICLVKCDTFGKCPYSSLPGYDEV